MLESYCPKIIDKKTFIEYYSNVGIEKFINDMEKICKTFKGINISKDVSNVLKPGTLSMYAQGLIQEGVAYMLNLPIGKKAKSILTKAATDLVKIKGPKEGYKNAILILEDLVNSYR